MFLFVRASSLLKPIFQSVQKYGFLSSEELRRKNTAGRSPPKFSGRHNVLGWSSSALQRARVYNRRRGASEVWEDPSYRNIHLHLGFLSASRVYISRISSPLQTLFPHLPVFLLLYNPVSYLPTPLLQHPQNHRC